MKKISLIALIFLLAIYSVVHVATARAAAPIGNYLVVNGGYVKLETSNTQSLSGFSFEAWIKPDTTVGRQIILSIGDKTQDHFSYEIGVNGGSFFIHYFYSTGAQRLVNAGQIQKNVWNHVAATISGTSTVLYVNGKAVYTAFGADTLKPVSGNIILGNSYLENSSSAEHLKGLIDEVRISAVSRNISGLWTDGVYNSSLIPDSDTLLLWRFDQLRGETFVTDSSPNNWNSSLVGGDSSIHFFGVLPSPTPFTFNLPVLPTLDLHRVRFIGPPVPVSSPTPVIDSENPHPFPTSSVRIFPRRTEKL